MSTKNQTTMQKEKLSKFIGNFRVSEKTFLSLEKLAKADDRTLSSYLRKVLNNHVNTEVNQKLN